MGRKPASAERTQYENPHSHDLETAIEYAANDILDRLIDGTVRETPSTFADRQAAKLERMYWATGGADDDMSETEAILFKIAYDSSESDKDKDGNTIEGTRKKNTLALMWEWMPNLGKRQLQYLMSNFWSTNEKGNPLPKEFRHLNAGDYR